MNGLHNKNAIAAGTAGIILFAILLIWNPLKDAPKQQADVKYPNLVETADVIKNMPAYSKPIFPNPLTTPPSGEMDPDTLEDLCARMAKIRENPEAYAEVKKGILETTGKREGEKQLATLNALEVRIDVLCENGEPKP